jgi:nucleotide-binding universal stress UspA family protein
MHSGPIVIGYDGSPAAEHAVAEAGDLLSGRPALVVVVWNQGLGFELLELPTAIGLPPAQLDIRTALEIEKSMQERAQRLGQKGASLAHDAGFDALGLAVADDVDVPVSETIVKVARERDAQAVVLGAHGHGRAAEVIIGSTTRDVVRHAPCPVLVVGEPHG